jgi:hypothetical protein
MDLHEFSPHNSDPNRDKKATWSRTDPMRIQNTGFRVRCGSGSGSWRKKVRCGSGSASNRCHTFLSFLQCCGSMTFWGGSGSGSADPCLWIMDPDTDSDPDPGSGSCYFRHWPSRCQQETYFLTQFFSTYYFLKLHLHHFWKIKSQKESQNSGNQGFSYYFCMMIQGSGSRAGSGSGSIPLTSGSESGSGRPKNMWIRWIPIRNTAFL